MMDNNGIGRKVEKHGENLILRYTAAADDLVMKNVSDTYMQKEYRMPDITLTLARTGCPERFQQLMGLPAATVAQLLAQETQKFLKHLPSDDLPGIVLFTKAITEHDEEAWAYLYHHYAPLVLSWVTQQHDIALLLAEDGGLSLVNNAFARFYQALTPEKLDNFVSLRAFLYYLRCCTYSAIVDERRARQGRQYELPLERLEWEPIMEDPTDQVVDTLLVQALWTLIAAWTDEREHLLLVLTYSWGMMPAEISRRYPHHFPTTQEVYRVKRALLHRLRRHRDVRELREQLKEGEARHRQERRHS
jgi:hypothetical protein